MMFQWVVTVLISSGIVGALLYSPISSLLRTEGSESNYGAIAASFVSGLVLVCGLLWWLYGEEHDGARHSAASPVAHTSAAERKPLTARQANDIAQAILSSPLDLERKAGVSPHLVGLSWKISPVHDVRVRFDRASDQAVQAVGNFAYVERCSVRGVDGTHFGPVNEYSVLWRDSPEMGDHWSIIPNYVGTGKGRKEYYSFRDDAVFPQLRREDDRFQPLDGARYATFLVGDIVEVPHAAIVRTEAVLEPGRIAYWGPVPEKEYYGAARRVRGHVRFTDMNGVPLPVDVLLNANSSPLVYYSQVDHLDPLYGEQLFTEVGFSVSSPLWDMPGVEYAPPNAGLYIYIPADWSCTRVFVNWCIQ